jgi:hypothetical protein
MERNFKAARNGNVKGTHPSPKSGEEWGTLKFKGKTKTTSKTKKPQDELPEWYHRRRSEVNCGEYGRKGRATRQIR